MRKMSFIIFIDNYKLWGPIIYGPGPLAQGGVQRPKPKKVTALAQKYKAKNGPEMQPRTV